MLICPLCALAVPGRVASKFDTRRFRTICLLTTYLYIPTYIYSFSLVEWVIPMNKDPITTAEITSI